MNRGSRFIFKGTETKIKYTCKSVKASHWYTSHPLPSEFDRFLQMSVICQRLKKNFWRCLHVFLFPFFLDLWISPSLKWIRMLSRLPSFVLQTSYSDKTKKMGQSVPSATIQTSTPGWIWGGLEYQTEPCCGLIGENMRCACWTSKETDRWSEDLTDSWHDLSHQPRSAHFLLIIRQLE